MAMVARAVSAAPSSRSPRPADRRDTAIQRLQALRDVDPVLRLAREPEPRGRQFASRLVVRRQPGGHREPPLRVPLELDVAVAFAEPGAFGEPRRGLARLPGTQQDEPAQQQRQLHPDGIARLAVQGEGALEQRAAFA
jgi:hypothetical protein